MSPAFQILLIRIYFQKIVLHLTIFTSKWHIYSENWLKSWRMVPLSQMNIAHPVHEPKEFPVIQVLCCAVRMHAVLSLSTAPPALGTFLHLLHLKLQCVELSRLLYISLSQFYFFLNQV